MFPFPVDPVLTGIVVNYKNAEYIADRVLPRVGPALPRQLFKYNNFSFDETITLTDTKVGRKGEPNTVEFSATETPAQTSDYGLDAIIPNDDIANAPAGYDPRNYAAETLTDMVALDREVRVASKVFGAATYPSANKATLSSTSQWSHVDSDPTGAVADAADSMVMSPNIAVLGRAAWSKVRRHPKIIAAISISGTDKGMATLQAVADLWELEEIIVGSTWLNSAKPGQAATRVRVWGKHCALLRREKLAKALGQLPTFGFTAEYGTKVAGQVDEPKIGLRGSVRVRSGESVAEVISAADLGYLFTNAVA